MCQNQLNFNIEYIKFPDSPELPYSQANITSETLLTGSAKNTSGTDITAHSVVSPTSTHESADEGTESSSPLTSLDTMDLATSPSSITTSSPAIPQSIESVISSLMQLDTAVSPWTEPSQWLLHNSSHIDEVMNVVQVSIGEADGDVEAHLLISNLVSRGIYPVSSAIQSLRPSLKHFFSVWLFMFICIYKEKGTQ